jgi:hypothetical protein
MSDPTQGCKATGSFALHDVGWAGGPPHVVHFSR